MHQSVKIKTSNIYPSRHRELENKLSEYTWDYELSLKHKELKDLTLYTNEKKTEPYNLTIDDILFFSQFKSLRTIVKPDYRFEPYKGFNYTLGEVLLLSYLSTKELIVDYVVEQMHFYMIEDLILPNVDYMYKAEKLRYNVATNRSVFEQLTREEFLQVFKESTMVSLELAHYQSQIVDSKQIITNETVREWLVKCFMRESQLKQIRDKYLSYFSKDELKANILEILFETSITEVELKPIYDVKFRIKKEEQETHQSKLYDIVVDILKLGLNKNIDKVEGKVDWDKFQKSISDEVKAKTLPSAWEWSEIEEVIGD